MKKPTISYLVLVSDNPTCNIPLKQIKRIMDKRDELVILADSGKITDKVQRVIEKYTFSKVVYNTLNYSYSEHRNIGLSFCVKDYVIALDDDEKMSDEMVSNIYNVINNHNFDLCLVSRLNYFTGLTDIHRKQMGDMIINNNQHNTGLDLQTRFFKNHIGLKWSGNLHERIIYTDESKMIQLHPPLSIIHTKDINKHIQTNINYDCKYTANENKGII